MDENFLALDIETQSCVADHDEYALQPWRLMEGKAKILTVMCGPTASGTYGPPTDLPAMVGSLGNSFIWGWNTPFDVAWLIAADIDCAKVRWLDAMSAAKHCFRSQHTDHPSGAKLVSWSLGNIAKLMLTDWQHYAEFMDVKTNFSFDHEYLERRCALDTEATLLLGQMFYERMSQRQWNAFLIESEAIYPVALAWMAGSRFNIERARKLAGEVREERCVLLRELMHAHYEAAKRSGHLPTNPDTYNEAAWEKMIGSNDQLATFMYDIMGVPFDEDLRSPKAKSKKRPVNNGALTFLIERYGGNFPYIASIRRYRELKSQEDKFLKGPEKAVAYLQCATMRHHAKINATYTGRMTYGSKC